MRQIKNLGLMAFIGALITLCSFTTYYAQNWAIKKDFSIKFEGTKVKGEFENLSGSITFDPKNLAASKMAVNVTVESIATGNFLKNSHAKGEKWFHADKFPLISITSTGFTESSTGNYLMKANLDMHGVKKEVNIPFTFTNNVFKGSFSVNRMDYGVGNMEGMSKSVGNAININLSVPVISK